MFAGKEPEDLDEKRTSAANKCSKFVHQVVETLSERSNVSNTNVIE